VILLKAEAFVSILKKIASEQKTVYAWGMFGSIVTRSRIEAKAKQYPYWYTANKISTIFAPLYQKSVWGFDCIGLIKGVLWGWNGDSSKVYGGAVYASNGVPDISADAMIDRCTSVSSSMTNISVGEYLWMKGHCGIYIGNGKVVESTPKWNNGVQVSSLSARNWLKHGFLPFIEYEGREEVKNTVCVELAVLKKGSKGAEVKTLQRLLKAFGFKGKDGRVLDVDGSHGSNTDYALRSFQQAKGLAVDGICGKNSSSALLK
jgi:hypothetical protein